MYSSRSAANRTRAGVPRGFSTAERRTFVSTTARTTFPAHLVYELIDCLHAPEARTPCCALAGALYLAESLEIALVLAECRLDDLIA